MSMKDPTHIPEVQTLFMLADMKGVSGTEIANKMGVTRSYISQLKVGRMGLGIENFKKFADALGYDVVLIDRDSKLKTML